MDRPHPESTWLAELLQLAEGVHYVHEPDNDGLSFAGLVYKQKNIRFLVKKNLKVDL